MAYVLSENIVPFFPFAITRDSAAKEGTVYIVKNHLMADPLRINHDAARLLRLFNGEQSVIEIADTLVDSQVHENDRSGILKMTLATIRDLYAARLVWLRKTPLRATNVTPPRSIFWEITSRCNLRCLHCVVDAGCASSRELPYSRCIELTDELTEYGVETVAFSGGEPFLHENFMEIARRAHLNGMSLQVATNGTCIDERKAEWLRELEIEVQVSLDGSCETIHGYLRPGQDAFRRTVDGIEKLVRAGHKLTIATVISNQNYDDIPSIIKFCENLGVSSFRPIPFVAKGRGQTYCNLEVSTNNMKALCGRLRELRSNTKISIVDIEFEQYFDKTASRPNSGVSGSIRFGCSGAVEYGTITPIGELLPCHFFEGVRADSVANHSFREVWTRSRFLNYFRNLSVDDLEGKCNGCENLTHCGGGCRAVNFSKGDIFAGNEACWVR